MALQKVPTFVESGLTEFLTKLIEERNRLLARKLDKVSANDSVLLISPGNKVYAVRVDDVGVLYTMLVSG